MTCPDDNTLLAFGQGRLSPAEATEVEAHADGCVVCQLLIAEAAVSDEPTPAARQPDQADTDEPEEVTDDRLGVGARLGRYVLIGRVGAGAMGTVYAGFDPKLERKVALKLLHVSATETTAQLEARLVEEAQAMARLSHPNVVSVFDVGAWHGRVWLAMEFVEGQTLREWMRGPRSTEERLRAVIEAGRGLAAAHGAGLIHRDFKPDNVLVGSDGRVCVTDFGLARPEGQEGRPPSASPIWEVSEDESTLSSTRSGALVGTPAYMAPDQLAGQPADARSDQFGFCMVAWEVLSGERPLDLDQLRSLAVSRLSQSRTERLAPAAVRGDARRRLRLGSAQAIPPWVQKSLQRGLESDPERRFDSMEALLATLSDDPRIKRRQRLLWAGGVSALMLGIAALGVQQHQAAQLRCAGGEALIAEVWGPETPARLRTAFEGTGVAGAGETSSRVSALLDAYGRGWAQMHHQACVATRLEGAQTEEGLALRIGCLERRRKELRSVVRLLMAPDPDMVRRSLDLALNLASLAPCADLETLSLTVPPPDSDEARKELPALQDRIADVHALYRAGRYPSALERVRAVMPQVRALGHRPTEAEARFLEGTLLLRLRETDTAQEVLVDALSAADAGRDDRLRTEIALRLGFASVGANRFEQADTWLRLAEATIERIGGDPEQEAVLASNRGSRLLSSGDVQGAIEQYERARVLAASVFGPEHHRTASMMQNMGLAYLNATRDAEAAQVLRPAIAALEKAFGPEHIRLVNPLSNLGHAESQLGHHDAALRHSARAVEIVRATAGPAHLTVAERLDHLATVQREAGKLEDALATSHRALAIKRAKLPPGDAGLSYPLTGIGRILVLQGKPEAAIEPLEEALEASGSLPLVRGSAGFELARAVWRARGDLGRAKGLAAQAKADFVATQRPDLEAEAQALLQELAAASKGGARAP